MLLVRVKENRFLFAASIWPINRGNSDSVPGWMQEEEIIMIPKKIICFIFGHIREIDQKIYQQGYRTENAADIGRYVYRRFKVGFCERCGKKL